jgi:DNA-binding NarL/FixJ family response regulator
VRIVLGEDSVLLTEGLARLLREAGYSVVAAVGDAHALLAAIEDTTPDLAVVDVRMPPTFTDDGLRAALQARRQQPGLGVLVLSQYVEEAYARELLADGGRGVGYLLKDRVQDLEALVDALDRVPSGGSVLDPEVVAQLLVRRHATEQLSSLTPRERSVLSLMAEGRSNTAIADTLVVSEGAVEKHVSSIPAKLDLAPIRDGSPPCAGRAHMAARRPTIARSSVLCRRRRT